MPIGPVFFTGFGGGGGGASAPTFVPHLAQKSALSPTLLPHWVQNGMVAVAATILNGATLELECRDT